MRPTDPAAPLRSLVEQMKLANEAVNRAFAAQDYVSAMVRLALIARQFLREEAALAAASPQLEEKKEDKDLSRVEGIPSDRPLGSTASSPLPIPQKPDDWTPVEALYAFMGWLTARHQEVTFSGHHNAAVAVDLIAEFAKRHALDLNCRDGWHALIVPAPNPEVSLSTLPLVGRVRRKRKS